MPIKYKYSMRNIIFDTKQIYLSYNWWPPHFDRFTSHVSMWYWPNYWVWYKLFLQSHDKYWLSIVTWHTNLDVLTHHCNILRCDFIKYVSLMWSLYLVRDMYQRGINTPHHIDTINSLYKKIANECIRNKVKYIH